ncbi:MAG: S16 family serine protease [Nitriliruptoraceae bacterium]
MRRSVVQRPLLLAAATLVTVAVVAFARVDVACQTWQTQPACYVAISPGPMVNAVDAVQIVRGPSHPTVGQLLVTTIAVDEHLGVRSWIRSVASPAVATVRRDVFYPSLPPSEIHRRNAVAMSHSQQIATTVALGLLGYDLTASAADGNAPIDIRIDAGGVGGPSAGLMFSLGIVERLSASDVAGGLIVAGTGTVDADGTVGPVGGVRQKLAGATLRDATVRADVFLVPRDNLSEARGAPVSRDIVVVPVDNVAGALDALGQLRAGVHPDGAFVLASAR